MAELAKAEALKSEKQEKERELQQLTETSGASGHQKLRVCDICGAYLSILDSDRRLADHFGGKVWPLLTRQSCPHTDVDPHPDASWLSATTKYNRRMARAWTQQYSSSTCARSDETSARTHRRPSICRPSASSRNGTYSYRTQSGRGCCRRNESCCQRRWKQWYSQRRFREKCQW